MKKPSNVVRLHAGTDAPLRLPTPTTDPLLRSLLRLAEVAMYLGISQRGAYELIYRGRLASVYLGRSRRVKLTVLESFAAGLSDQPAA